MNYAELYAIRAQQAVDTGIVRFNAIVEQLLADGVPVERINEMLLADLDDGGPIFGKLFRDLRAAGETAISTAEAQGSTAAELLSLDKEIADFAKRARLGGRSLDNAAIEGDPEALEAIEDLGDNQRLRWVAALRNTCAVCLSLHGKELSRREWRDLGYRPRTVHPHCECDWVPVEIAAHYQDIVAPLKRQIKPGQPKGARRTIRAISQQDVDDAIAAREKALQTKEGRKILRELGRVGGGKEGAARMAERLLDDANE